MTSGGLFDTDVSAFKNIDEEEERQGLNNRNRAGAESLRASDESLGKIGEKQQQ